MDCDGFRFLAKKRAPNRITLSVQCQIMKMSWSLDIVAAGKAHRSNSNTQKKYLRKYNEKCTKF